MTTSWKWLARSMAAGAFYDAAFAVAMLAFPEGAARLLGIPAPGDLLYLRFAGLLLLLLGGIYCVAAAEPARYQGVIVVAAIGRFLGFAFLLAAYLAGRPRAFLALALADLAFAALHCALLVKARTGS